MDTLKKAKEKYKLGASVIDLSVVLINKAMDLINNKVLTNAERVNKELSAGNLDKGKRMGPLYVDMLKNYMTIVSTMNLLVADSHAANYERKMIIRALLKSVDSSKTDKKSDYILAKVISLEKHMDSAAKNIVAIANAIKPVSGGAVKSEPAEKAKKSDEPPLPEEPVKDLSGVSSILLSMSRKIEMALSEIKLVNKSVLKLVEKKGSFETMRTDEFDTLHNATKKRLVKGGVDTDGKKNKVQVKIVGGAESDDIYIGGSALDLDLEIKSSWVSTYKHDKLAMRDNPTYANMVEKKILDVFKVDSVGEMKRIAELDDDEYVEHVKGSAEIDNLLLKQIDAIINGGKLQQFLAYYIKHRNQYAPSKTELKTESFVMGDSSEKTESFTFTALALKDDYINLNLSLTEDATVEEKLQYIADFVKIVMEALNKVDIQGIVNKANDCFERINEIKTADQLADIVEELNSTMKSVIDKADLLVERKRVKIEILKLTDEIIEDEGIIEKPKKTAPIQGSGVGELASHLFSRQMAFRKILGAAEQTALDQANTLSKLIALMDSLSSPDNKDPCVCKAIHFACAAVYIDVLPKLAKKRFPGKLDMKKIEEHRQYLADKAKLPVLYNKHLDEEAVRKLAAQLVDPNH